MFIPNKNILGILKKIFKKLSVISIKTSRKSLVESTKILKIYLKGSFLFPPKKFLAVQHLLCMCICVQGAIAVHFSA